LLGRGSRAGHVRGRAGLSRRRVSRGVGRAHTGRGAGVRLERGWPRLRRVRPPDRRGLMGADLSTTVAGVRLPLPVMNAAGTAQSPDGLRRLLPSRAGAIVLGTTTVHPFVHPEFRGLHNVGFDKYAPLVRELTAATDKAIVASIAGATSDELLLLARAFADAGAALVEINLADPWIAAAVQPFEDPGLLRELLVPLTAASRVPLAVRP